MKAILALGLIVVSASAFAKVSTQTLVNSSPVQVSPSAAEFHFDHIAILNVPTVMVYDAACVTPSVSDSDSPTGCMKPVSTVDAIQVMISFNDDNRAYDGNASQTLVVNLPTSLFSAAELAQIKTADTYTLDLTGEKTERNQALAASLLKASTQTSQITVPTVACTQEMASPDDASDCAQYTIVGSQKVNATLLSVTRR